MRLALTTLDFEYSILRQGLYELERIVDLFWGRSIHGNHNSHNRDFADAVESMDRESDRRAETALNTDRG